MYFVITISYNIEHSLLGIVTFWVFLTRILKNGTSINNVQYQDRQGGPRQPQNGTLQSKTRRQVKNGQKIGTSLIDVPKDKIGIMEFTGANGQCSTLDAVCCCSQCLKLFLKSLIFLEQLCNQIFRKLFNSSLNSCPCLKFSKIISRTSNFIVVFSERVLTHCSEMFVVSTRPCRLQFILTRNVFLSDNFLQLLGLIFCKTVLKTIAFIVGKIENPAAQNLFIHFPLII